MRNILLVAAENSAETYAVQVVNEFAARGGGFHFWGIGGDRLAARGFENVVHNRTLSLVGIVEVLAHLWRIRGIMRRVFRLALERRADAALLIDYPDFNLRLARRLRRAGIPVYYYISPTVWAWRYGRVAQLRRWVSRLFIIFPFEVPIYEKERVTFTYTGHPLLSEVRVGESRADFRRRHGVGEGDTLLALLPGSREAEVRLLLPEILGAVGRLRREFSRQPCAIRTAGWPSISRLPPSLLPWCCWVKCWNCGPEAAPAKLLGCCWSWRRKQRAGFMLTARKKIFPLNRCNRAMCCASGPAKKSLLTVLCSTAIAVSMNPW